MPKGSMLVIGGPKQEGSPVADRDPGAGSGDSFGAAADALARAAGVAPDKLGTWKAALRAAIFALYREYEDTGEMEPADMEDTGY